MSFEKRMWALLVLCALTVSAMAEADAHYAAVQWAKYKALKSAQAEVLPTLEAGTYAGTSETVYAFAERYADLAGVAVKLDRPDIQGWQLNNAAWALICYFKQETAWDTSMATLHASKAKSQARLDLARAIQDNLRQHLPLLDQASTYLEAAEEIEGTSDDLDDKVESNQDFILWVHEFVEKKL